MKFAITREPDDPLCIRASVGGGPEIGGYYLVFRGDPERVVAMLEAVTKEAREKLPAGGFDDQS